MTGLQVSTTLDSVRFVMFVYCFQIEQSACQRKNKKKERGCAMTTAGKILNSILLFDETRGRTRCYTIFRPANPGLYGRPVRPLSSHAHATRRALGESLRKKSPEAELAPAVVSHTRDRPRTPPDTRQITEEEEEEEEEEKEEE